jgi:hypothetical protein
MSILTSRKSDEGTKPMSPEATTQTPILFRLPKPGTVDPYFGGNRSFWNERILATPRNNHKPEVRSVVVRKRGALKGCRFISFESALLYFNALAEQQGAQEEKQ